MNDCRKRIRIENPKTGPVGVLKTMCSLESIVVGFYVLKGVQMSCSSIGDLQASTIMELSEHLLNLDFSMEISSVQTCNK